MPLLSPSASPMLRALWRAGLSLSALCAASVQAAPVELTVFLHNEAVGTLGGDTQGDSTTVSYRWNSNGRGPDLNETIRTGTDGLPTAWTIGGTAMMGGSVQESFALDGKRARWKSQSETGDRAVSGSQLYAPTDATPWAFGVFARALLKAPDRTLTLLPFGKVKLVTIRDTTMGAGDRAVPVTVYRLDGLDLQPTYVVLDRNQDMFAWFPQTSFLGFGIRKGYESLMTQVSRLSEELEEARVKEITATVTHRYDTPIRFRNVRIYDPRTLKLGEPSSVVVSGERIVRVMPLKEDVAADATGEVIVEGNGGTLMPGLNDMHAHLSLDSGLFWLAAGVTSIREMGSYNDFYHRVAPLVDKGIIAGPRMTPSGILEGDSQYALNMGFKPKTLDDALADVHWYADHGYDMIKFYSSFDPKWVAPVAAEAHRLGLKAGGHIPAFTNVDEMLEAGYDNVVHANLLLFNWLLPKSADTRTLLRVTGLAKAAELDLGSPAIKHTIDLFKRRDASLDPTTIILERLMLSRAGTVQAGDADYLDHVPIGLRRRRMRTNLSIASPAEDAAYKKGFQNVLKTLKLFYDNGVKILPGTDDQAGFALHRELELYTLAGIPTPNVLRMATLDAQAYYGRPSESGVIERGKLADVVLLAGDPTRDIKAIKAPRLVMKGGTIFYPSEIYTKLGIEPFGASPAVKLPSAQ